MIKRTGILVLFLVFALAGVSFAGGGLDAVKSLAGKWTGKSSDGKEFTVTYTVISGGTAVQENLDMEAEHMVTTYYADGDSVMLTHFCMANNQPRMRAKGGVDPTKMTFSFVDATNLASPDAGHMHQLVLTMPDKDHLSEEWTWMEKGAGKTEEFDLVRAH